LSGKTPEPALGTQELELNLDRVSAHWEGVTVMVVANRLGNWISPRERVLHHFRITLEPLVFGDSARRRKHTLFERSWFSQPWL